MKSRKGVNMIVTIGGRDFGYTNIDQGPGYTRKGVYCGRPMLYFGWGYIKLPVIRISLLRHGKGVLRPGRKYWISFSKDRPRYNK